MGPMGEVFSGHFGQTGELAAIVAQQTDTFGPLEPKLGLETIEQLLDDQKFSLILQTLVSEVFHATEIR